jgi:putative colanic acid biosynthesis acetyltransferase WcaF
MRLTKTILTKKNKFLRFIWNIFYFIFIRFSPRPLHEWRSICYRLFGAKIGKNVHIYPSAKIWAPWNLIMSDNSSLDENVDCYNVANVKIGKNTRISRYSFLCTASHDYLSGNRDLLSGPITIDDNVWIAADVYIAPGIFIGKSCIILARCCIYKDVNESLIVKNNSGIILKGL